MSTLRLTVVDAFTDRPFCGNPAAVTVVDAFPAEATMQDVAREMNLSETAFVVPREDGDFDLRWFTPAVEVDLCGHATLAAAHVLGGAARFLTRSGLLTCVPTDDGWIAMDLPADPPVESDLPPGLGLGDVQWFGAGRWSALALLPDAPAVRDLTPDLGAIGDLPWQCLIVTAAGDRPGVDCVSRVFGPQSGIPEDPVTGSAHCALAEFWGPRLGTDTLVGEQASARGGTVRMHRLGERVTIGGQAVTTAEVRLVAPIEVASAPASR
ncbi:MAG TPA: PhzF family phenazine biosynthesis protein [Acidimicrobiales bacterium]|nr:PhzF family phenazine biosynthesis protein [Acidimicrobiales bacterium]